MKKRFLLFGVLIMLLFTAFPAFAENVGGTLCDNLTWEYNTETKTLTIGGNGAIDKMLSVPWYEYESKIEAVKISDGITAIPNELFWLHTALKNVHIGKGLKQIGDYAFSTNFGYDPVVPIETITVDEDNEFFCAEGNVLFDKNKTTLIKYSCGKADTEYNVPETVQKIGYKAFLSSKNLQAIGLTDKLSEIAGYAFKDCTSLTSITLPDSLTAIGTDIFYNTAYIKKDSAAYTDDVLYSGNWFVKAKSGVKNIQLKPGTIGLLDGCFELNSYSLQTLYIPETVRTIPGGVFKRCSSLNSISVNENNEYYMSNNGILYNKSITELLKVPPKSAVINFNIPNTVTAISKSALSSCASLETVTIPPSVINIEKTVFTDCNSLKNINADAENEYYTSIDGILYDKNKTVLMAVPKKSAVAKLDLPDTVETIGEDAASDCEALTEVIFPESVKVIEDNAFDGCSNLESPGLNEGLTQIGDWAFYGCEKLNITKIPETVTAIGGFAFWATAAEENPENWQDGVRFYLDGCLLHSKEDEAYTQTKLEIRDGTRLIAQSSFLYASSTITEIVIPESLEYINDYVFSSSPSKLKTVLCYKTPEEWAAVTVGSGNFILNDTAVKYMPFTRSEISESDSGYAVKVTAVNVPFGKKVIVAGYKEGRMSEVKFTDYAGREESFTIGKNADRVCVYVWEDTLIPCALKPEIVLMK